MRDEDAASMIKVWLALEVRQFIHASIQDVRIFENRIKLVIDPFCAAFRPPNIILIHRFMHL